MKPTPVQAPSWDRLFRAMGHPAAKEGLAAWGERSCLHCPPWPASVATLCPWAPAHLLLLGGSSPGSSSMALLANTPQTTWPSPASSFPALPSLSKPGLPLAQGAGVVQRQRSPPPMHTTGVSGLLHKIGLRHTPRRVIFACAMWPFKKAYISHFPRGKKKKREASGADVVLQRWG